MSLQVRPVHPTGLTKEAMETNDVRICDLCGYSTSKASRFKKHKMIHIEKPFRCGSCDFSSTFAGNLKRHSYTHTGEKPYKCGSCDYSCTQAVTLKRHSYTHTGKKNLTNVAAVTSHALQLMV